MAGEGDDGSSEELGGEGAKGGEFSLHGAAACAGVVVRGHGRLLSKGRRVFKAGRVVALLLPVCPGGAAPFTVVGGRAEVVSTEWGQMRTGIGVAKQLCMNVGIYQAASAMNAMDRWQEVISQNLSSNSVPGFKKQDFAIAALQAGMNEGAGSSGGEGVTNFAPGEIRVTGLKTDVAIDGKAFFEVQLPNGATAYTRDGEFHVDAQGQLVTKSGYRVLGDGGPLVMDLNNYAEMSISANGEVSQGADLKGRLKLTEFGNPQALTRLSGSYFMADNPAASPNASTASSVRQGAIETSNTSSVMEMANLMTAMRTFEANQKMVQIQDERIAKAIQDLSSLN